MSSRRQTEILAALAAGVWIAGAAWTAHTLGGLRGMAAGLNERGAALASMRALAEDAARDEAARQRVRAAAALAPVSPAEVIAEKLPGVKVSDARTGVRSLGDGWSVRDRDFVFDDASIDAVMALVDDLDARRPPWRLASLEIRASAHAPGTGQVALTLTAIQPDK